MTPEQVELEFEHIMLDRREKDGGEVYADDTYDEYERETEANDRLITVDDSEVEEREEPKPADGGDPSGEWVLESDERQIPDEWEDVEIDDFEGEDA